MIKLIYSYYKPYRGVLALVLFLSLLTAVLDLVFPVLVRHILNTELPQKVVSHAAYSCYSFCVILYEFWPHVYGAVLRSARICQYGK